MFSANSPKLFFTIIFILCSTSCSFWRSAKNENANTAIISDETESNVPFESKEPENFQTEIIITNFLSGEKTEKKYFLARSGNKKLTVFNRGEKTEFLVLDDGVKTFFINGETKTFRENKIISYDISNSDEMRDFLTTDWLNRKTDANFEKLETQNNLTNYRVRLGGSLASEIILTYDENLKMPVKQEFYSISGEQRNLTMTIELQNFQTPADEKLFVLPQDYKRIETK